MKNKLLTVLVVGALVLTSVVLAVGGTDGTDDVQNGSSEHPYIQQVSIPSGGSKTVYVSLNLTAFKFTTIGDGYYIQFGHDLLMKSIRCSVVSGSNTLTGWPEDDTQNVEGLTIKLTKVDETGVFGFTIKLLDSSKTTFFNAIFSITSQGVTQSIYYKFNIIEEAPTSYSLTFTKPTIGVDGLFSSQGTLLVGGNTVDMSKYRFYAVGLKPGISIHNNLTVTGRADLSSSVWSGSSTMPVKVAVTDLEHKTTVVVDAAIDYTISSSVSTLDFRFTSGDDELLNGSSSNTEISLLSGTALSLTVSSGTEASIVYTDTETGMTQKTIYSTASVPTTQVLNTSGNGTYQVIFTKTGSGEEKVVFVNIVGSLTPLNSIRVTCGPI